jgi:hypothetical protein
VDKTTYMQRAEAFLAELELENYRVGAGLKPNLEIAPIYARYAELFSEEAIRARVADRGTVEARYLASFAVDGFLENQVKGLTEEITNAELEATVSWDGAQVPYQQVPILLMNEDDRPRRGELARRYYAGQAELNPKRIRRWNQLHSLARSLGFADYVAAFDDLRSLDLHHLAEQMAWLLDVTQAVFERELGTRLAARGVPRDDAATWDVSPMFRAREFDALFPAERLLPALRKTLAGLGIDLDAQANVQLDTEARPLKSPRAFCSAVHVPQDVRLVIQPAGGRHDYGSLFHEAGHAEHYAHVSANQIFPYRCLGDTSVTETYAFLLEHLLFSPAWLEGVLGLRPGEYEGAVQAVRFDLLWLVRRYAAKMNYEMELHAGLVDAKASAYVFWLHRGCRVQIPPQRFLEDVDDGFYVAHYLRAWIFESQLRRHLENTFGPEWFARREAGDLLKGLWHVGQQYPVTELARQIGAPGLDLAPLVAQISAV